MKICKKCDILKPIEKFGKNNSNHDGLSIYCKDCEKIRQQKYRKDNPDYKNSSKKWRLTHPEKYRETQKKYLDKNPEMKSSERLKMYRQDPNFVEKEKNRNKIWLEKNKERLIEYRKIYYSKNRKVLLEKNNQWKNKKMKEDGFYRMKKNLRDRIRSFLKEDIKSMRTKNIVGLDSNGFKSYIQQRFTEGMSWDNYGEWHLDHIKPLSLAKSEEEVIRLNHHLNLQPMWAIDNQKKHNKYND